MAAFDKQKSQWIVLTHKKADPTTLTLFPGEVEPAPQATVKWLGVVIDPKLSFTTHIKIQAAKGRKAANRLAALARTGWGIPLALCKRLITALIFSRTNYACVVWHKPGASASKSAALKRVDNVAHRFGLGVFKTHPLGFLLHETNSISARARLDIKTDKTLAQLLTLPQTNPAGVLNLQALSHNRTRHRTPIHHAIYSPSSIWTTLPSNIEVLDPFKPLYGPSSRTTGIVAETKEESIEFVHKNVTSDWAETYVVFCDGANQTAGTGAGAVASDDTSLKLLLGSQEHFTAYDGKLASVMLALGLARAAAPDTKFIWILNKSQTFIRNVTSHLSSKSGQHLQHLIAKETRRLLTQLPDASIACIWCAKGAEMENHVKAATKLMTSSELPISHNAIQQIIRKRERPTPSNTNPTTLLRLHLTYQPLLAYTALAAMSRPDATFVPQIRAGHCPLNAYLFCFHANLSPLCAICGQKESVEHYLLLCKKYVGLRKNLFAKAAKLKNPKSRQGILTEPKLFHALADFG